MFFKSALSVCLLLAVENSVVFSYPQSDWVWGKSGGSGSIPAASSSSTGNTGSSTGSGGGSSGIVHGFTSSGNTNGGGNFASASGSGDNVVITTSQGSGGSKPTVIVQVLQPGSTTINGLNAVSTNNNSSSLSTRGGAVAATGEGRLFLPRVGRFVHNALQNLVSGGVTNNNNNNGGLFGGGSNFGNGGFLNSLLQLGNRIPSSTSSPSSSSSSNNDNEFNTEGNGGGSSGSSGNSGGGGGGGSSFTSLGQNCRCTSADQCRLPSVDKGTCSGGIMCCRSSSTRTVGNTGSSSSNTRTPSVRFSPGDLRVGLFEEIVRGSGNVVDNAIDFLFAPFLTQEDQQRLATRIGGTRKG